MVATLLARSSWRFYKRHPAQLLLSLLGILLGVGIVTAVLITNASSTRAFSLSTQALYGKTSHHLQGASGIEQADYVALRLAHARTPMAPIVDGHVAIGNDIFTIIGIDPFAEQPYARGFLPTDMDSPAGVSDPVAPLSTGRSLAALLKEDGLLISAYTQARLNLPIGEILVVETGGGRIETRLFGSFDASSGAASDGLLIGDIAWVQTLLQRGTRIDRVDLVLSAAEAEQLREQLPGHLRLVDAASREQSMQAMTRGFQINLTAMSLLALLVGAFLIHNTMTFAVLQRRELFAIKRITGLASRTLLLAVLAEAALISTVASLLGVLLGYALAHGLIALTTQTINDLYFVLHIQEVRMSPGLFAGGLALGIGSSLLAASISAIDAASTSPIAARQRSMAEQRRGQLLPWLAGCGVLLTTGGGLLAVLPTDSLVVGFGALMLLIVGYGLCLPWCIRLLARALRRPLAYLGLAPALSAAGIEGNISRTGLAIAALTIAVSATFGVDVMIGSFRASVDHWLGNTLHSDVYVSAPSTVSSRADGVLNGQARALAEAVPGVRDVGTGRALRVSTSVGDIGMLVLDPNQESRAGFELISGDMERAWPAFTTGDSVLISEPLANRHGLAPGEQISLFTPSQGNVAFSVAGVFRDYGSSHGSLTLSRQLFDRYWDDARVSSLGLLLDDNADPSAVIAALRQAYEPLGQALLIRSNRAIHETSLAVFDRTFEVTRVLRWLTVGVAFVGIFSALQALHLERAREFAVLRASGGTRRQVMAVVLWQTVLMGLFAAVLSLPLGWLMSDMLIHVINVRSFGWTMQSLLPEGAVLETVALALTSAVLAGLYPAWRLGHQPVATQLREE